MWKLGLTYTVQIDSWILRSYRITMCALLHTKRHNLKIKIAKLCFRLAGTRFIFPLKTTETHDKIVPACRLESSSSPSEKGEPSQSLASSPRRRDRADVWEAKAVWFPGQGTGMEGYPENPTSYDPLHRQQSWPAAEETTSKKSHQSDGKAS